MTREEAINMLYDMRADNLNLDDLYIKDKYDALTMAIKALEQEPCTDSVSMEAVIEWLKDKDIIKLKSQEENARKELQQLYSVTPQPKTLDKIKTEIIEERKGYPPSADEYKTINKVLQIIDKYKAESEET